MGTVQRKLLIYIPLIGLIVSLGLPARLIPQYLPSWYVTYAGDFLWAMLVFFLYALLFRLPTKSCFCIALITAYLIEISQLFHPAWLDYLRSIRLLGFVLGFGFLWSDLIAYTLGISLAAGIDRLIFDNESGAVSGQKTSSPVQVNKLELALDEVEADYREGRFVVESVEEHIQRIKRVETTEHG